MIEGLSPMLFAAVVGSMIGSFLNVCIVRLPADQSIVRPRSRCPRCETPIAWYDNIPIVSWMLLRARCRRCQEPISPLYPTVEAVVALIWAGSVWWYGPTLDGVAAGVFGTIMLGIGVTDARHYLIPDEYTLGGLALGLAYALREGWHGAADALIGAAVGFGLLYAVAWLGALAFKKEAMGGGDIKMMAMVGAFTGWQGVVLTMFGGALLGTIVFVPMYLVRPRLVPFGVFLAAAGALVYVWGDATWAWYMGLVLGR